MKVKLFNNLRSYIVRANLTNSEFAKCIGMSRTSLYSKLIGDVEFKMSEMLASKKVLNERLNMELTIDELFFNEEGL